MSATSRPPYIEKIDERGNPQVWIVDGSYIRGHIDVGFTNYGQHYQYPYIPLNELWIDYEAKTDERRFYIDHLLIEYKLMAESIPYEKALAEAERIERRERRCAGDVRRLTHKRQKVPDGRDVHQRLWQRLENGVSVWIVNGRLVRSVFDINFAERCHNVLWFLCRIYRRAIQN